MITPFTLDVIIYADELAYFTGRSLKDFRERKTAKLWARIQRWYIERSIIAAVAIIPITIQAYV
jgi:hypothetical protein